MSSGVLHLIPTSLGSPDWEYWLPPATRQTALGLKHWVVENAKTARAHLKALGYPGPIAELSIIELPQKPNQTDLDQLLAPALTGMELGLMSEAGCPAVADPGALLVRRAHERHLLVKPHVGPSSLLLALMASGLDGQRFSFHGYLPVKEAELQETLKRLEKESAKWQQTQLFIETPYRNQRTLTALLAACRDGTRLSLSSGLTTPEEKIITRPVREWKHHTPTLEKIPTIFGLLA